MANEIKTFMYPEKKEGPCTVIVLTKKEAVEIISLLAGQLAEEPLVNNNSGAAPLVKVLKNGRIEYFLNILVK